MTFCESWTTSAPSASARRLLQAPILRIAVACGGFSACSVGPDYVSAGLAVPARYAEATRPVKPPTDLGHWWKTFHDPVLDRLIDEAVAGNLDVSAAAARIREARATRLVAVGGLFPVVYGDASAIETKLPGKGAAPPAWLFRAGFDASWELDLFGGQRRAVEAATRGVEAADAGLRATLLTLIGDVNTNYIEMRGAEARISLASQTAASQRQTAGLTKSMFEAGSSSELDLANATALAASTEAVVPQLEQSRALSIHRLGILLGREPGALLARLRRGAPLPQPHDRLRPGLPADLLSRRPDIAMAERQLAQATARIGVADAALYPSVSLTGSIATSASRIGDLGKGFTIGWSWGPSLTVPIFAGGQLVAAVDVAGAQRDETRLALQSLVLTAMEEVENSLVLLSQERIRMHQLGKSAGSYRQADQLSKKLWQAGAVAFLSVLDAERSLYSAEDALIQSRILISIDAIALAKALGGGWDDPVDVDHPLVLDANTGPHLVEAQ